MRRFAIAVGFSFVGLATLGGTAALAQIASSTPYQDHRQECRRFGVGQRLHGDELAGFVSRCMSGAMPNAALEDRTAECHAQAIAKGLSPESPQAYQESCIRGTEP
jgi:hypothetical protein